MIRKEKKEKDSKKKGIYYFTCFIKATKMRMEKIDKALEKVKTEFGCDYGYLKFYYEGKEGYNLTIFDIPSDKVGVVKEELENILNKNCIKDYEINKRKEY